MTTKRVKARPDAPSGNKVEARERSFQRPTTRSNARAVSRFFREVSRLPLRENRHRYWTRVRVSFADSRLFRLPVRRFLKRHGSILSEGRFQARNRLIYDQFLLGGFIIPHARRECFSHSTMYLGRLRARARVHFFFFYLSTPSDLVSLRRIRGCAVHITEHIEILAVEKGYPHPYA